MKKLTLVCIVAMAAFVMTACGNRNAKKAAEVQVIETETVAAEATACCAACPCEECKCEDCKCADCCAETVVVEEADTAVAE